MVGNCQPDNSEENKAEKILGDDDVDWMDETGVVPSGSENDGSIEIPLFADDITSGVDDDSTLIYIHPVS